MSGCATDPALKQRTAMAHDGLPTDYRIRFLTMKTSHRISANTSLKFLAISVASAFYAGSLFGAEWKVPKNAPLLTRWAKDVSPSNTLPDYPRPQMVREQWQNLNGLWDYAITGKAEEKIPAKFDGTILVPFPIESALSGVMKPLLPKERLWYRRMFSIPKAWRGQRILLHFGAVDWEAAVQVNGRDVGGHRGGYDSFALDITRALKTGETQEVVVSVLDPSNESWHLHGKQTLHPGGCSYTADRDDRGHDDRCHVLAHVVRERG